jgi:hypothetical protein
MADWRRVLIFGLACAGILASLLLPWWVANDAMFRIEITLRKVSACTLGECRSVEAGGAYGVVGVVAFAYGWLALIGLGLGGVLPALAGQPTRGFAYGAAIVYLLFAGLAYATLDLPEVLAVVLHTHWPLWAGLGGATLALVGPMALAAIDRQAAIGAAPAAARVPAARARTTEPPPRAARTTEPPPRAGRATEPPRAGRTTEPPRAGRTTEPPRPARTTAPPLPADLPLLEPVPLPPPAPRSHSGLRFAVAIGEARDDGLLAVDEDGVTRQLRWDKIGGVLARELRGPAPLEQALLVDLVPAGEPPLRFVTTTRLSFLGADVPDVRVALRRLITLARTMNPRVEIEPATAAFVDHAAPLPAWTVADLDRYDARYRAPPAAR